MDRELRCPRCEAEIGMEDAECAKCHFALRRRESTKTTRRKTLRRRTNFFSMPRFLQKEPQYAPDEVHPKRFGWKTVAAFAAAAAIVVFYRIPVFQFLPDLGFFGIGEGGGTVSVEVMAEGKTRAQPGTSAALEVSGSAFDLWTLEPVGDATLIFESIPADRYVGTRTLADGRFKADVSSPGAYYLKVHRNGYLEKALVRTRNEFHELRRLRPEARKKMGRQFRSTVLPVEPLRVKGKRSGVVLLLVPDEG